MHISLILVSLGIAFFSFIADVYANTPCELNRYVDSYRIDYQKLIQDPSIYKEISATAEDLPVGIYWPLNANNQEQDLPIIPSITQNSGPFFLQYFSQITIDPKREISFSTITNTKLTPFDKEDFKQNLVPKENLRVFVGTNSQTCIWPKVVLWQSDSPFTENTKIQYVWVSSFYTDQFEKASHLEVHFQEDLSLFWVRKQDHIKYGISSDRSLYKYTGPYKYRYLAFRKNSGIVNFELASICSYENTNIENYQNQELKSCLSKREDLSLEASLNWTAQLHLNERDAHWAGRLSLFPPEGDDQNRLKTLYNSDVNLFFSPGTTEDTTIMVPSIEFGAKAPSKIDVDSKERAGSNSISKVAWDPETDFVGIKIHNREYVEIEFLKIQNSSKDIYQGRIIEAFTGRSAYSKPTKP